MRGQKYPEEIRIRAMEMLTVGSVAEVARALNLPEGTLQTWKEQKTKGSKEFAENFKELREEKKKNFVEQSWKSIDLANQLIEKRLKRALDKEKEIDELLEVATDSFTDNKERAAYSKGLGKNIAKMRLDDISKIAITYGTLYDKQALAQGDSTQNTSIKIELAEELEDYAK